MEQKLITINHIFVGFCWLSLLATIITTLFGIGNIWLHMALFLITPFRYLIFEIYPKVKEEQFKVNVDRLMPFSILSSFISRPYNSKQQRFLNYLGAFFWFLATLIFNGYHLLWLDTIYFHEGESVFKESEDKYDQIGKQYHLYSFQVEYLRQLSKSDNREDHEKLTIQLNELKSYELAKQLSPLGLSITQDKLSRFQNKDGTFEKNDD